LLSHLKENNMTYTSHMLRAMKISAYMEQKDLAAENTSLRDLRTQGRNIQT